jgi:glycosyltransferase involved in cell wall biosynthesis
MKTLKHTFKTPHPFTEASERPLVSVIVSIYNVEKYLARCIRSIVHQSYRNIEIILVNDASTDHSLDICRRFAARDERIHILDLPVNGGLNHTRFHGLDVASGSYVAFVDSDDYFARNAIEVLLRAAIETGADIVDGQTYRTYDDWGLIKKRWYKQVRFTGERLEIVQPQLFDTYFISYFGNILLNFNLWGKLYLKSLFERAGAEPNNFKVGEDWATNIQLFPYVRKYVLIQEYIYYYRYGGGTARYNPYYYIDYKVQYGMKLEAIRRYQYQQGTATARMEMCHVLQSHLINMVRDKFADDEILNFIEGELKSGFIDEIICGIEGKEPWLLLLEAKDALAMLRYCRDKWQQQRWKYVCLDQIFPLLRFI